MRRRRLPRSVLVLAIMLCVAGAVVVSFITLWVPTKGKAWLEADLERTFPVETSIGAMRYALFRGIVLDQVRIDGRAAHETWCAAPTMTVGITWPALLHGQLIFRAIAPITAPCHTDLVVNGRYPLRAKTLTLNIRTSDSELAGIAPPLKRHLPPSLTEGRVRLNLRLTRMPAQLPTVSGGVIGSGLVWTTPTATLRGQLTAEGTAAPPSGATDRWSFRAALELRQGTLEGPAPIGTITDLTGSAQLDDDRLQITSLTGRLSVREWPMSRSMKTRCIHLAYLTWKGSSRPNSLRTRSTSSRFTFGRLNIAIRTGSPGIESSSSRRPIENRNSTTTDWSRRRMMKACMGGGAYSSSSEDSSRTVSSSPTRRRLRSRFLGEPV